MFLIITVNEEIKSLNYNSQLLIHDDCESYTRLEVFLKVMVLKFFFIPIFKWNKNTL